MIKKRTFVFLLMKRNRYSQTAEFMALFRALESARPPAERLFTDPYADCFLRPSFRALVRLARLPLLGQLILWLIDRSAPGARPSGTARTRLIDDWLGQAIQAGTRQLVILGAGFDCRSIRLAGSDRISIFELDRPDTLRVKKQRIIRELGSLPQQVKFIEFDFDWQKVESVLEAAGFDWSIPAFIIWEGVTNYLSATAVDATFELVAAMAAGTSIAFTYVHRAALDGSGQFKGLKRLKRRLRRLGEPRTFGFDPAALDAYLDARGLELIDDIGSIEYRSRYMAPAGRHMMGYEFYRAALALVRGKSERPGALLSR
jgi:methyltransferase (TIGR00027 family)